MAANNFKPFATAGNANVTSQADYEALPALATGFQAGKASSAQVNKALRQASFIAAALAQFVSDKSGSDVLDDGDLPGFISKLAAGFSSQYLSRSKPFADIKADNNVSAALANLGLGDGTSLPFGVPIPWPTSTPPTGWITMSGQTITAAQYPKLYALYGANLPDLRGEFIRGWDNGRGTADKGRALLSEQQDAIRNITGGFAPSMGASSANLWLAGTYYSGAISALNSSVNVASFGQSTQTTGMGGAYFDASRSVPVGSDNRPLNIAFNYIVRGI